jgi:hypothetical protein
VTHDEWALAAYLEGDLDDRDAAAWDEHLLECGSCWAAVEEALRGRTLAASLRDAAPAGLRDRVEDAVRRRHRTRQPPARRAGIAAVSVGVLAVLIATGVLVAADRLVDRSNDAESIALVLRLAADGDEALASPTEDGIFVTRLAVDGRDVVLARSERPFPMPDGAVALTDDPQSPWLARRGDVSLFCFSHPAPMLLAGRAPPETLAEVAAVLGIAVPVGRNQTGARGVSVR